MKITILVWCAIALASPAAWALDDLQMPVDLDRLAARATETVDVTLDKSLLQLAAKFLSDDDPDNRKVKKLVERLKSIYVRSFEFSSDGQYSPNDLNGLRLQLKTPAWSRIVGVKSNKGENSDIFLKRDTAGQILGLVVIASEPRELTVVHIDGPINVDELSELGGHMGIPKIGKDKERTAKAEHQDARP